MVVVTDDLARKNPRAVAEFYRMLGESRKAAGLPAAGKPDMAPFGKETNRRALELLVSYCVQQKLVSRRLDVDELF